VAGTVRTELEAPIAWVIIDNPERHNAMSSAMFSALVATLARLDGDDEVRVIVLRGAGEAAFAAGADIGELGSGIAPGPRGATPDDGAPAPDHGGAESGSSGPGGGSGSNGRTGGATGGIGARKPVVAMIHGYCIGGGLLVALGADIRLAAADARFAIPAVRLGVGYPYPGVRQLVAAVGPAAASELLLTGERFDAADALRWGLVSRVFPASDLEDAVRRTALAIAQGAPLSVAAAKAAISAVTAGSPTDAVAAAEQAIAACWASEDMAEGRLAFAEKRPARFRGR
jgi:enoyl-CoA hydratase